MTERLDLVGIERAKEDQHLTFEVGLEFANGGKSKLVLGVCFEG